MKTIIINTMAKFTMVTILFAGIYGVAIKTQAVPISPDFIIIMALFAISASVYFFTEITKIGNK